MERSIVIALQKSAEGIVGCTLAAEGLNKFGTVIMQEEISDGTCRTARAVPAKWQRVN
jgi:hypothetical protein